MGTEYLYTQLNQKYEQYIAIAEKAYSQANNGKQMPQPLNHTLCTTLSDTCHDGWLPQDSEIHKIVLRLICSVIPGMISTNLLDVKHGTLGSNAVGYTKYCDDEKPTHKQTHLQTYGVKMGDIPYTLPEQPADVAPGDSTYSVKQDTQSITHIIKSIQSKLDAFIIFKIMGACVYTGESWDIHTTDTESTAEHYRTFKSVLEQNGKIFYNRLKVAVPTYIVIPRTLIKVFRTLDGFTETPTHDDYGFFYLGMLDSLDVYVAPIIEDGSYLLGVCVDGCTPGAFAFDQLFYDYDNAIHSDGEVDVNSLYVNLAVGVFNPDFLMKCKVIGAECSGEQ